MTEAVDLYKTFGLCLIRENGTEWNESDKLSHDLVLEGVCSKRPRSVLGKGRLGHGS